MTSREESVEDVQIQGVLSKINKWYVAASATTSSLTATGEEVPEAFRLRAATSRQREPTRTTNTINFSELY